MRRLLCAVVLISTGAAADILPDDVAVCQSKALGAKCVTDEGVEGTCQETLVSRPDYSGGIPPKYKQVKMLTCVTAAKGTARSMLPWFGAGLSFLALLMAMLLRRGGGGPRAAAPVA